MSAVTDMVRLLFFFYMEGVSSVSSSQPLPIILFPITGSFNFSRLIVSLRRYLLSQMSELRFCLAFPLYESYLSIQFIWTRAICHATNILTPSSASPLTLNTSRNYFKRISRTKLSKFIFPYTGIVKLWLSPDMINISGGTPMRENMLSFINQKHTSQLLALSNSDSYP